MGVAKPLAATARVRTGERSPPQRHPARTPDEIAARLFTLAEKIDRRVKKRRTLTADEAGAVAKRIRSYALRLRAAATSAPFSV